MIGIGIVPALLALSFRFTIPESPRYKLDILQNASTMYEDTRNYYGVPELDAEHGELEVLPSATESPPRPSISSSEIAPDDVADSESVDEHQPSAAFTRLVVVLNDELPPGDPNYVSPLASWVDARNFFLSQKATGDTSLARCSHWNRYRRFSNDQNHPIRIAQSCSIMRVSGAVCVVHYDG